MLSGISRKRSIRSNPYWFTEFCNSQCISHFAAPFIVVRAETSVAESCNAMLITHGERRYLRHTQVVQERDDDGTRSGRRSLPAPPPSSFRPGASIHAPERGAISIPAQSLTRFDARWFESGYRVRMILPQVHLRKPCYDFSFL